MPLPEFDVPDRSSLGPNGGYVGLPRAAAAFQNRIPVRGMPSIMPSDRYIS